MTMAFNTFVAMGNQQKIVVIVSNDLSTDQRVRKMCHSLQKRGYDICLVGRKLNNSLPIDRPYQVKRFQLWFNKGGLFYANLNISLFFYLLFSKYDRIHANDLDTLLAAFIVSKLRNKPLVYDTHEIFTEVPEIQGRWAKKVWQYIENTIFPHLEMIITVNKSISEFYGKRFSKEIRVIRNIPEKLSNTTFPSRKELGLPENKFIVIAQGSGINIDRGNEELLLSMEHLKDVLLLFVGSGDAIPGLKKLALDLKLDDKVIFIDRMPYEKMMNYTANADLGISLDKASNLNYLFSLPNKVFDYIHAGIPILASQLPEVSFIINNYQVGSIIEEVDPNEIIKGIENMRLKSKHEWQKALAFASSELTWERESEALNDFY
jgi:glycosyltransferase involved in cell wall biosynthesis